MAMRKYQHQNSGENNENIECENGGVKGENQ
jgi:hypothetical protein